MNPVETRVSLTGSAMHDRREHEAVNVFTEQLK